jgi:hypothetical protein
MLNKNQVQILKIQNFGDKVSYSHFNKFSIPESEIVKHAPVKKYQENVYLVSEELTFTLLYSKHLTLEDKVVSEFSY